ncbi:DUF3137 domain-containing protein [Flammeovirga pectinis]|uniref:DUF3137 domain-containing protein n=1 Tax=Flammeovirga pectinis TaxID=2494373 RepID=A0A3S9P2K8_9BACT|nr:DUF3137 domain-containing protein [Flammeovirga pectinis]AZQ62404.1 DUF3137 domain-containing protein [Flammeovirga pectinis]
MKSFEEFKAFFKENIKPQLEDLEAKRFQMHNKRLQFGGLTFLMIFIAWILVYLNQIHDYGLYFMCIFAPFASHLYFKNNFLDETIEEEYKELVVREMIRFMDPSLHYEPEDFIPINEWIRSGVDPLIPDIYTGDDLITGSIDGINITVSEVEVAKQLPPKNKWYLNKKKQEEAKTETIFHGFFMIVELKEPPASDVYIFEDDIQKHWGHLGRLIEEKDERYGTYVPIKHPKYREIFKVYAENRAAAESSLKDDFIEKLYKIKKHFKAKVNCVVKNDKMYVFLDIRKELFKVDTTHSLTRSFILKSLYNDLYMILTVTHTLNKPVPKVSTATQVENNFGQHTTTIEDTAPVEGEFYDDDESAEGLATNHFEINEEEASDNYDDDFDDEEEERFDIKGNSSASQEQLFGVEEKNDFQHFDFENDDDDDYYDDDDKE